MELLSNPQQIWQFASQPWHWAVSGVAIASILFLLTWMGRSFGVSTAFRNFCHMAGAGKKWSFFNFDLKSEYWRMAFVFGAIGGGFIAANLLQSPEAVAISDATIAHLADWGVNYPEGHGFMSTSLFDIATPIGILLALAGGFLVGFGARYGDGCTSGHAISGLSHLQLPSLITVIGFFIGGLFMTWVIMPLIFG
ncbi:MAG: YeeE/YedE family protein [Bacteroidetes bacterium]|nr:MAG: YeeE/YedE family protein [Bacteroidota bacterium]